MFCSLKPINSIAFSIYGKYFFCQVGVLSKRCVFTL